MPTPTPEVQTKTEEPKKRKNTALDTVLKDFDSSWKYASSSWHDRWSDNNHLYNNQSVNEGYVGVSKTFVPMCFSTVETLTSALFGSKPKYNYVPPQDKQDQNTDILNGLLDFYWDKDQWSLKNINTGRCMLKLGTSIDYYMWVDDHPVKINIPIRDFFIDPTATSLENARYMGRRYLTTKKELESFEVIDLDNPVIETDPDTGEQTTTYRMKKKYKGLNRLDAYKTLEKTDKEEKDMWYGSTLSDPPEDQVEVLEYWTKDKTISVANRSVVIEDAENYFKAKARANGVKYPKGLMPFNDARDYVDESLFYAKGEIDFIATQQEYLNDLTRQYSDAIGFVANQMYTLDPRYATMIDKIENIMGAVYPVEKDALIPIPHGTIPNDIFNQIQNIKNEIRETTGANEIVKGAPAEGGNATATEINAQVAGAGQRIGLKVTQLENGYFHREARIVLEMVKLYVTEPMMIRIIGKDGAHWEQFDPAQFQGEYEPRVQLDISIQQKKQQQSNEAANLLQAFMGNPVVNQQELAKIVMERAFELDPDEVGLLIQVQPPMGMDDPIAMAGALPPEPPLNPVAGLFPQEAATEGMPA